MKIHCTSASRILDERAHERPVALAVEAIVRAPGDWAAFSPRAGDQRTALPLGVEAEHGLARRDRPAGVVERVVEDVDVAAAAMGFVLDRGAAAPARQIADRGDAARHLRVDQAGRRARPGRRALPCRSCCCAAASARGRRSRRRPPAASPAREARRQPWCPATRWCRLRRKPTRTRPGSKPRPTAARSRAATQPATARSRRDCRRGVSRTPSRSAPDLLCNECTGSSPAALRGASWK